MKLLASDYDGTLRTQETVKREDVEAIERFRSAGNLFGVVTGRSMESLQAEIERNGFSYDFIITNNGGVLFDGKGGLLESHRMDFDKALDIISYIKTLECASYVINDGYHRYKFNVDSTQEDHKYGDMPDSSAQEAMVLDKGKIAQLVISLNDDVLAHEIAEHINTNFNGYASAYVNINCVDIVPSGISKADGIYYMEDFYQVAHEDVYAIGDSYNDLPMLEAFHGCAVAHAQEEIRAQAEHVFFSVKECIDWLMEQ